MPMKPDIEAIAITPQDAAAPSRRAPMAAYMRDQFVFLGTATPARRAATRTIYKRME